MSTSRDDRSLIPRWYAAAITPVLLVGVVTSSAMTAWVDGPLRVVGALGTVPDLVRLLTGRLHGWQLLIGPEALTYRGYRTDETIPWSTIHGASIQRRKPAGVRIDRKGAGPDVVVPIAAFDVPAGQIVEELGQMRQRSTGR